MKTLFISLLIGFFFVGCQFSEPKEEPVADQIIHENPAPVDSELEAGEILFKENCAACHAIHDRVVGPALRDINSLDRKWLYLWVKDSQALIRSGDERANRVFKEYNKIVQPNFNLTEEQIDNIVKYIHNNRILINRSVPQVK